tara:strand:- start:491 stop:898 length:408 start_codon:yes stop_codon:yes gene_type:complete
MLEAIKSFEQKDNLNQKHRKDNYFHRQLEAIDTEGNSILTLRTYHTGKRVYACLWVSISLNNGDMAYGSGWAGGYGYCKESTACEEALMSAGIELQKSIAGKGMGTVQEAIEGVARDLLKLKGNGKFLTLTYANA